MIDIRGRILRRLTRRPPTTAVQVDKAVAATAHAHAYAVPRIDRARNLADQYAVEDRVLIRDRR